MLITPASLLYRLRTHPEATAWARFIDLYTPLLFHWSRELGDQESDRADLIQDVFLILWRKLPEFEYDTGRSFHAWLKTIFLNRHRSILRQRKVPSADGNALQQIADGEPDGSQKLADDEDQRYLIRQAYRLLESEFSVLHQQVFREYVLAERSPEEVAREYRLSLGTVYGIKSKILSRLRQELQQILDDTDFR